MHNLFILSGPSGAGEDSVIAGLEKLLPIERVITTTTREPRKGESDGHPYYFITQEAFQNKIAQDAFVEYAKEYNGHLYGVTREELERVQNSGKIGIWKIEYKGVMTAKKMFPDVIAIFLTAPLAVLEERIRTRDHVTDAYVAERMAYTKEWLKHADIYDYRVENHQGHLDETIQKVAGLLKKHASL